MTSDPTPDRTIDAVVIGTSAGGIEALLTLLPALPGRLRASVFVVIHLPPTTPSLLADIFGPRCQVPVREAEDKEAIAPGTVYFAPPDYHLLVDAGRQMALSADDPVRFSRPSIDVLFESAADLYGDRLLGIVLTGANDDGAAGLEAVHLAGGLTVVQRPDEAVASLMVESALQRVPVNHVWSLEQIADFLRMLEVDDE
jgi:two-component system chemotaxis response regulator CheB